MGPEGHDGGLHHLGVAGQAQVVVGAEVEDLAAGAGHTHARVLLPRDHPLSLPGARLQNIKDFVILLIL